MPGILLYAGCPFFCDSEIVKALYLPASIALNKSLANEGSALNDLTKLIILLKKLRTNSLNDLAGS